jgi:hypothetical protein
MFTIILIEKILLFYQTESHAKSQKASSVSDEPDDRDFLISLDPRHDRVLDVNVDQGHVALGVPENFFPNQLSGAGKLWITLKRIIKGFFIAVLICIINKLTNKFLNII